MGTGFKKTVGRTWVLFGACSLLIGCSNGFQTNTTLSGETSNSSDSTSSTPDTSSTPSTPSTPDTPSTPPPAPDLPEDTLSIVSFSKSSSEITAGQKLSIKAQLNYSGSKLAAGKNLFVHFVTASNPNWFEFSLYPVPGPASSTWNGLTEFAGEIQIPSTAAGTYSIQIGVNDPQSSGASRNIKLEYSSPTKETFGSGEIGYRYIVSQINVNAPTPTPAGPLSLDLLIDDMSKPHESTVHGINPNWSWGTKPRLGTGVNIPAIFDDPHFVPWGVVGTSTQGSQARNTRVQIRKVIFDVKRNGVWSRVGYNSTDNSLAGAFYKDYETNENTAADKRPHGADGISVKLPDAGGSFHFYTSNRFRFARGAQEIIVRFEARLIVDDPSKADDRTSARLLACSGGDFWKNASQGWDPNVYSNDDFAIGRFRYVTNEWAVFTSHTFGSAAEVNDYLANEPSLSPR